MHPRATLVALTLAGASLVGPATAVSGDAVTRPMSGACATAPVVVPSPIPGALFRVIVTGTCQLTHLGRTEVTGIQDVFLGASGLSLSGHATYTAADGDRLGTSYGGPVQPTGATSVAFSGTETFIGGTGRFSGASGSTQYAGSAITAPPGQPGSGSFTVAGSITF